MTQNQLRTCAVGFPLPKVPSNRWLLGLGITALFALGGGIVFARSRSVQSIQPTIAQSVHTVTALGRLEPHGEVIQNSA